jgi:transcriptional regulator with XRE-family HTH domain
MPAQIILDTAIGPRVLLRIMLAHPSFTPDKIAEELGCGRSHVYKILNGTAPLTICQMAGLAKRTGDPLLVFGPELDALGLEVTPKGANVFQRLARLLESAPPGGDGGADISDAALEELGPFLFRLEALAAGVRKAFDRRGLRPVRSGP